MTDLVYVSPIITAVVEVAKRAGLPAKLCPLLAALLGIAYAIAIGFTTADPLWLDLVINGLIAGLSAVGLYEIAIQPSFKALKIH